MKVRLPIVVCLGLLLSGPLTARAQSPGAGFPPPPAMAVADRLVAVAAEAGLDADRMDAKGDKAGAYYERDIRERRLYQAIQKYAEVPASATYSKTPYAATALMREAETQTTLSMLRPRKDPYPAIQIYKTLLSPTYADIDYPEKPNLLPELHKLQLLADTQNRTFVPEKYFYAVIDFFVKLTGARSYSYFLALLFISVIAKLLMWPLANKQYRAMKQMQKLQPVMKEIQTKYKSDPQKMQMKMMELYKEHDAHPLKGCAPTLLSLPIWYFVYYMVRIYEFQFSHGKFLWIGSSLSHMHLNFMGLDLSPAANLSMVDVPLLLLYGLTMYLQQKMMPLNPDPQQAEQQKMMMWMAPCMSTFFFLQYHMPSAFVLYFLISNVLSMAQQAYQNNKMDGGSGSAVSSKSILSPQPDEPESKNGTGGLNSYMSGNGTSANGAKPAARGAIAPKVHAKKKRR